MKALILGGNSEVRAKLVFSLEGTFGSHSLEAGSFEEAGALMASETAPFDLMICDLENFQIPAYESFRSKCPEMPMILCLPREIQRSSGPGWNVLALVERGALIENVLKTVQRLVDEGKLQNKESILAESFCKIRTKLLLSVCPLRANIFIKLSEDKYIKLMKEGDTFDLMDMEKYTIKKGVQHLYIRRNETKEFIDKYRSELEKLNQGGATVAIEELGKIGGAIHETVQEMGARIGFTNDVQLIVKAHVKMAARAMSKEPGLAAFLAKIDSFRGEYLASHSLLTGYFACAMAAHLEWGSESTFHKLTLAAFLHDITLDSSLLARQKSLTSEEAMLLSESDRKKVKDHCALGAEIARKFTEVPPDIDQIILQHHEQPDGSGFPRGITYTYISPLATIFIVAHEMADYAIERDYKFQSAEFMRSVQSKYASSQFRKVLTALENLRFGEKV